MSLNITDLLDKAQSHAAATGHFERVGRHEPLNPPTSGLTAAMWPQRITPVPSSGLASTSVRVELAVRIYKPVSVQDPDSIDPQLLAATDALMAAYSADFTLGGAVRKVDLLGSVGDPLDAEAGYLEQDGTTFRVMTITLPLVVNDLWEQTA